MTQQNPFAGITLHTRGYLNADHLIAHLIKIGYSKDCTLVETLIANAVFPMKDLLSFSIQEEIPSKNGPSKDLESYSFWHHQTRGDNLDIPMCVALMEHVHANQASFLKEAFFVIKTRICIDPDGMACYLAWDNGFGIFCGETYHDVIGMSGQLTWISAQHVQKKCQ